MRATLRGGGESGKSGAADHLRAPCYPDPMYTGITRGLFPVVHVEREPALLSTDQRDEPPVLITGGSWWDNFARGG